MGGSTTLVSLGAAGGLPGACCLLGGEEVPGLVTSGDLWSLLVFLPYLSGCVFRLNRGHWDGILF